MRWKNLRQAKGQSVQIYTQELHKQALILGIPLDPKETHMKCICGLHSYLRHSSLMLNPTKLDEVCVQATHLENQGNNVSVRENFSKKPSKPFVDM